MLLLIFICIQKITHESEGIFVVDEWNIYQETDKESH